MYSITLPHIMSCVFGSTAAQRCGMEQIRSLDRALSAAHALLEREPDSPTAQQVKILLREVWFWQNQLSLEVIQAARDGSYNAADPQLRELAFSITGGPSNSKYSAEDVFGHLHHVCARAQKGMARMNK